MCGGGFSVEKSSLCERREEGGGGGGGSVDRSSLVNLGDFRWTYPVL